MKVNYMENAKKLFYLVISITTIVLPTYIIFKYGNETFKGLIILFLFLAYPAISFVLGILNAILKVNIYLALIIFIFNFIFVVMYFLNSSALIYIPFYIIFYMLGNIIIKVFKKYKNK
ncbi:hypothetical protein DP130_04680 [Clostridium tetani]|uniref:Uncharacterized protein n=1 Tax=Clostridium tetani TaxID=1513 RepID=A0A4Q0VFB1_CLOTA|nr:hypothetical protein DP130_04680 [Clostridium tetani]